MADDSHQLFENRKPDEKEKIFKGESARQQRALTDMVGKKRRKVSWNVLILLVCNCENG